MMAPRHKSLQPRHSRPTLRNGVQGIYLPAPLEGPSGGRSANSALIASFTSSCGCSIRGCSGSACLCRKTPMASRPSMTRPSTEPLPHGPMMGCCGQAFMASVQHLAAENTLTPVCCTGDGTIPWQKKGDGLGLGVQTPEGREHLAITDKNGYVFAPCPVAPVNETEMVLLPDGLNALTDVAKRRASYWRRVSQPRWRR